MKRKHDKEREIDHLLSSRGLAVSKILYFDSVGSTMDVAFDIEGKEVKDRTLVIADAQTSGRGRFGRKWYSTTDDLLFSIILIDFDIEAPYSMVAALAVFKAFMRYTGGVKLKWINDLLWESGKKIAGILVEERAGRTVIGIGVNLNTEGFPSELRESATSLFLETGMKVPKEEFLLSIMEELIPGLDGCRGGKLSDLLAEWEVLSGMRGKQVVVTSGDREVTGTVIGLNRETGALLLSCDGEDIELYEGSLTYVKE